MEKNGFVSKVHFRQRAGLPLTAAQAKSNAARSTVCSAVETVSAAQKHGFGLFIRTIGTARAIMKICPGNIHSLQRHAMIWPKMRPIAA